MQWNRAVAVRTFLPPLLLAAAAFLVYGASLSHDFVLWDDDILITGNPLMQEFTWRNIWSAFTSYDPELYVPLTILSFQIEHALVGFAPLLFHVDNLLLHILNASLILLFLEQLGLRRQTAFLCALLFTTHPINAEAVAWVSARKDLLSTAFSLGSILSYLAYRRTGVAVHFLMTTVLLLFGILSKPVAILLPAVFLLLDWKENRTLTRRDWTGKIPLLLISIAFLIIGLYGKQRTIAAITPPETLLLAIKSTMLSLQKFFLPVGLSPIYVQHDPIAITLVQFWAPLLFLIIIGTLILQSARRTNVFLFGALFFLLFLLPSFTNFAKEGDIYVFSDRYVYLAQVGILFIVGSGIDRALAYTSNKRRRVFIPWISAVPVLVLLATAAHAQSRIWRDSETLFRAALAENDGSAVMHYNLAVLEHRNDDRESAEREYRRAIAINPGYAKALGNLGILLHEDGRTDEALAALDRAIATDATAAAPHNTKGSIFLDHGTVDLAITEFHAAIAINERYAQAHINLASALGRKGLYEEGLREYKRAFELAPQLLEGLPEIRHALENL